MRTTKPISSDSEYTPEEVVQQANRALFFKHMADRSNRLSKGHGCQLREQYMSAARYHARQAITTMRGL